MAPSSMREYYGRLLGEVCRKFALFGKEQIAVGAVAALFPVVREIHAGTIGASAILPSLEAAVGGYLLVCVVKLGWTVIHAPVELDRRRESEILAKDSALKIQTKKNRDLQNLLAVPKVSALEQERIEAIQRVFGEPPKDQIEVLKYILRHGQVESSALVYGSGLSQNAVNQVLGLGISKSIINPAHGKGYIEIKPEFVRAMELYLHGRFS